MDLTTIALMCLSSVHLSKCIILTTQPTPTPPTETKTEPDNLMQEAHPAVAVIKPSDDHSASLYSKLALPPGEHFGHESSANVKMSARSYQPPEHPYQFYVPIVHNANEVQTNKIEPNSKYTYYVPSRDDATVGKGENGREENGGGGYEASNGLSQSGVNGKSEASANHVNMFQGMVPYFGGLNPLFAANSGVNLGMNHGAGYANGLMTNLGAGHGFYGGMQPQMNPVVILNFGSGYQNPMPMMTGSPQFKYPLVVQPNNYQSLLYSMMQNQLSKPQLQTQAIFRSDHLHNKAPFIPSSPYNPEHVLKKQDTENVPKSPPQATDAVMDPRHLSDDSYQHSFSKYANFNGKVPSV